MEQPKVVIKNPYAKKKRGPPPPSIPSKKPTPSSTTSTVPPVSTTTTTTTTTSTSTSTTTHGRYVATTFSQAFGGGDDHRATHDTELTHSTNNRNIQLPFPSRQQQQQQQSPQQRTVDATAHPDLTDRESHVLTNQPHVLYVSHKQRGNAVLNHVRNVPMAHSRMVPDFILSAKRCALFLSCKYHALYPNYVHRRIAELGRDFELRVLLVLVDVQDNASILRELNKLCVVNDLTLILSWSEEEAARYLETYKAFDGKDATMIQKREQTHYADQVSDFLTACKTINKTDGATLLGQFGSLQRLVRAGPDDLALVPGMGQVKVKRLYDALHKPFSTKAVKRRRMERQQKATTTGDTVTTAHSQKPDNEGKSDETLQGKSEDVVAGDTT